MKYKTTNILRLTNTIRQNIQKEKLLNSWNNLLITFSGGQDSAFCLLILYLLKDKTNFKWDCKRVLDLSKQYKTKNVLPVTSNRNGGLYLRSTSNLSFSGYKKSKQSILTLFFGETKSSLFSKIKYPLTKKKLNLIKLTNIVCVKKKKVRYTVQKFVSKTFIRSSIPNIKCIYMYSESITKLSALRVVVSRPLPKLNKDLTKTYNKFLLSLDTQKLNSVLARYRHVVPINSYTLLWCNHFWQKDAFFTMEHVSKLIFSKDYTMHFFAPVKQVLSEQNARYWRHKVMQRLSLFIPQIKCRYESVELSLYSIFIAKSVFLTSTRSKEQSYNLSKSLVTNRRSINAKSSFTLCTAYQNELFVQLCKQNEAMPKLVTKTRNKNGVFVKFLFSFGNAKQPVTKLIDYCPSEQLCVQGHNKSDRAEAILFNLMRGTGMNGISTLQWKHTFFSVPNSNYKFYPVFSDFFKEIQIISLDSFFVRLSSLQKETRKPNKLAFLFNRSFCLKRTPLYWAFYINKNRVQVAKPWYKPGHKTSLTCLRSYPTFAFIQKNMTEILKSKLSVLQKLNKNEVLVTSFCMAIPKQSFGQLSPKGTANLNKSKVKFFLQNSHLKSFYYQLKYKTIFDNLF